MTFVTTTKCQCTGCKEFFNSVSAFDKHRVNGERCLSVDEMIAKKMVKNETGHWCIKLLDNSVKNMMQKSNPSINVGPN